MPILSPSAPPSIPWDTGRTPSPYSTPNAPSLPAKILPPAPCCDGDKDIPGHPSSREDEGWGYSLEWWDERGLKASARLLLGLARRCSDQ